MADVTLESLAQDQATIADRYNLLQAQLDEHLRDHALMDEQLKREVGQMIQDALTHAGVGAPLLRPGDGAINNGQ
jgi:hypothetical protein